MPVVPVTDLVINANANVIRAATFGRGVYSSDLYSACTPSLTLNSSYAGNSFYEASSTITSAGSVLGGTDTHVFFKSGGTISFTEGFNVKEGNEFKAYLAPCGDGMPDMNSKTVGQNISLPDYHFSLSSFLEVAHVSDKSCELKITSYRPSKLKLIITDENNKIVKQEFIMPVAKEFAHTVNYSFAAGKMYKAVLFADDVAAHWQEVIR